MKYQLTITIDTTDLLVAERIRDRVVDAIDDFTESSRPGFSIDCTGLAAFEDPDDIGAIEAARAIHECEGEVEIDENAKVAYSTDDGAYVAAWVWVPDSSILAYGGMNPETGAGMPEADPMAGTSCERCDTPLESGQIGACDECQELAVESEGGHCD